MGGSPALPCTLFKGPLTSTPDPDQDPGCSSASSGSPGGSVPTPRRPRDAPGAEGPPSSSPESAGQNVDKPSHVVRVFNSTGDRPPP